MVGWLRAWSLLVTCLLVSPGIHGASAADGETIMKNGLSSIHFARSGGFVALGKLLAGDVVFSQSSAVMRPVGDGPSRPLTAAEMAMFARLDPVRLGEFAEARRTGPASPGLPDDYQFDVAFTFNGGRTVNLTFHGQSIGDLKAVPVVAELAAWVVAEIEAIWAAR
jgi:hypothetical protein